MEKFSVLMSVYHKEQPRYLEEALQSIFNQTLSPAEIILVKDGKLTMELDRVIESFLASQDKLKIVALPQNVGLGNALNEGLKHCSYELVARMDSDDICKSNRFERQIAIFETNPDLDLVSSWIDEFENDISHVISARKLPETSDDIYHFAKYRCPVNHPVVMFKKQVVIAAGGYMHFPLFEDYYLWVRMLMNGAKFYNIQESLLYFRFSPDMFKRRGGYKYAMDELRLQILLCRIGFIGKFRFLGNVLMRFILRIMPSQFCELLYKKVLR